MNSTVNGENSKRSVTVIQGEIEISKDVNIILTTILGSCISVCMWDPEKEIGGMNHFLLAEGLDDNAIKYGAYAMEMLINKLLRAGATRSALQSKVFGGAAVSSFATDIGQKNAIFARDFLKNEGIPCVGESVGGKRARRVRFTPVTGNAQMQFVQPTDVAPMKPIRSAPTPDITLF